MLNKRLYKKITFVVILLLIPVSALVFRYVAKQESGFLCIVLTQTNQEDTVSKAVVKDLLEQESIILFTEVADASEAVEMVKMGQADAAWIFADRTEEKIQEFVQEKTLEEKIVNVVVREETVFLRLANEKLFASLFEYCAKEHYIQFARTNAEQLDALSNEELLEYFNSVELNENFFEYGSRGDLEEEKTIESNYLITPLRGLFGILIVLCGMAATMYYMEDERRGTFSLVKENKRNLVAYACLGIAILNVAIVALISLFSMGMAVSIGKEMVGSILYVICCVLFCYLCKLLFKNIRVYGALIPLMIVLMIAICPVFFDLRKIQWLQLLFPPTYYVNIAYNNIYLVYMIVYISVGVGAISVLQSVNKMSKRNKKEENSIWNIADMQ